MNISNYLQTYRFENVNPPFRGTLHTESGSVLAAMFIIYMQTYFVLVVIADCHCIGNPFQQNAKTIGVGNTSFNILLEITTFYLNFYCWLVSLNVARTAPRELSICELRYALSKHTLASSEPSVYLSLPEEELYLLLTKTKTASYYVEFFI